MDEKSAWKAVVTHDRAHDGRLYYGVLTTGVYCRPSCPARRPKRENVRFYDTPEAAEAAGLRACLRCHPRALTGTDPATRRIADVCRYIEGHLDEPLTLAVLAETSGVSPFHLQRSFKAIVGVTPREYAEACRMKRLRGELRVATSVTDAIYGAGFGSGSRVYERSDGRLGMTPAQYRKGGEGVAISFASGRTALGLTMIGATDRGICFLQFGESEPELRAALAAEFPRAVCSPMGGEGASDFAAWMKILAARLEGREPHRDLPLDVRGTAFQLEVWKALQAIPAGDVRSYAEVATALGAPLAARAVARACATNRIAVLIPCHRVIRGNGELGGYRWGTARKRALLDLEKRAASGAAARALRS